MYYTFTHTVILDLVRHDLNAVIDVFLKTYHDCDLSPCSTVMDSLIGCTGTAAVEDCEDILLQDKMISNCIENLRICYSEYYD